MQQFCFLRVTSLALVPLLVMASGAKVPSPCDADNGGLTLPPGACARLVASKVGSVRQLTVAGNGDLYAFLIEDHAVAIQKWVATGARITGDPAPVSVSGLHVGASGRLRAVATTIDGGQAVHLELWLNGKKLIDYTDRDHPYTRGYMGLYVESISDSPSTAAAEFDNFTAAQS